MADRPRVLRTKAAQTRGKAAQEVPATRTISAELVRRKETVNHQVQEEHLEPGFFPPGVEPALVRVSNGSTINLGNYESMRIDVSVTIPCRVEDIDETYVKCSEFVAEKMAEEEAVWFPPQNRAPAKR